MSGADTFASLAGKVVLAAGVGPGLGYEIVEGLTRQGAHVVFGARTKDNLDTLGARVRAEGGSCAWLPTDITDERQVAELVDVARREFGGLDGVVNTARGRTPPAPVESGDVDDWRRSLEVNLIGPLLVCRAAAGSLRERGGGAIVMVNSMIVRKPLPGYSAYASAKAALLTATQVLAAELGPDRIRVNSVLPGYMDGPSLEEFFRSVARGTGGTADEARAGATGRTVLGVLPTVRDCARAVLFLLSDASSAMTGQTVDVNAGEVFA